MKKTLFIGMLLALLHACKPQAKLSELEQITEYARANFYHGPHCSQYKTLNWDTFRYEPIKTTLYRVVPFDRLCGKMSVLVDGKGKHYILIPNTVDKEVYEQNIKQLSSFIANNIAYGESIKPYVYRIILDYPLYYNNVPATKVEITAAQKWVNDSIRYYFPSEYGFNYATFNKDFADFEQNSDMVTISDIGGHLWGYKVIIGTDKKTGYLISKVINSDNYMIIPN